MMKSQSMNNLNKLRTSGNGGFDPYKSTQSGFPSTADAYTKTSYRQKGKAASGFLVKGSTSAAYNQKTLGSIPTKTETIVFMDPQTKRSAFGSNSQRFLDSLTNKQTDETDPGPGSYLNDSSTNLMLKRSDSFSTKGFGNGFLSKLDRFKNNSLFYSQF